MSLVSSCHYFVIIRVDLYLRMGKTGSLILWVSLSILFDVRLVQRYQVFVCFTAFFVVQTALQAVSRTVYAFSRDHGTYLTISFLSAVN